MSAAGTDRGSADSTDEWIEKEQKWREENGPRYAK